MIKKIKKPVKSPSITQLVNSETGETFLSECGEGTSIEVKEDSDLFTIDSEEYVVFDSKALQYICTVISKADSDKVFRMADMTKTEFNILFNNNIPHSIETLAKTLDFSENELYRVVKRLVKANVLCYVVCAPSGYVQKIYMLNPTLARKRKTFNKDLLNFFKDLSLKENQV